MLNGENGENLCKFTRFKILPRDMGGGKDKYKTFRFFFLQVS